ncbi:hypothetical protein ACOME3_010418 [Neoechinorhynchus agilis]
MEFLLLLVSVLALSNAAAVHSKDLTTEHIRPCAGLGPKSVKLQTCHCLKDGVCHLVHGDKIIITTQFKSDGDHDHNYELKVTTTINGELISRTASAENYKVDCKETDCTSVHNVLIMPFMPVGKHTLKYELSSVGPHEHPLFCYEYDTELSAQ